VNQHHVTGPSALPMPQPAVRQESSQALRAARVVGLLLAVSLRGLWLVLRAAKPAVPLLGVLLLSLLLTSITLIACAAVMGAAL
jgi:hypothetical protein